MARITSPIPTRIKVTRDRGDLVFAWRAKAFFGEFVIAQAFGMTPCAAARLASDSYRWAVGIEGELPR